MNCFDKKVLDKQATTLGFKDWEEFEKELIDDWRVDEVDLRKEIVALARQEILEKIDRVVLLWDSDNFDWSKELRSFLQEEEKQAGDKN